MGYDYYIDQYLLCHIKFSYLSISELCQLPEEIHGYASASSNCIIAIYVVIYNTAGYTLSIRLFTHLLLLQNYIISNHHQCPINGTLTLRSGHHQALINAIKYSYGISVM